MKERRKAKYGLLLVHSATLLQRLLQRTSVHAVENVSYKQREAATIALKGKSNTNTLWEPEFVSSWHPQVSCASVVIKWLGYIINNQKPGYLRLSNVDCSERTLTRVTQPCQRDTDIDSINKSPHFSVAFATLDIFPLLFLLHIQVSYSQWRHFTLA